MKVYQTRMDKRATQTRGKFEPVVRVRWFLVDRNPYSMEFEMMAIDMKTLLEVSWSNLDKYHGRVSAGAEVVGSREGGSRLRARESDRPRTLN